MSCVLTLQIPQYPYLHERPTPNKSSETVQAFGNDSPERLIRFAWYLVDCMIPDPELRLYSISTVCFACFTQTMKWAWNGRDEGFKYLHQTRIVKSNECSRQGRGSSTQYIIIIVQCISKIPTSLSSMLRQNIMLAKAFLSEKFSSVPKSHQNVSKAQTIA